MERLYTPWRRAYLEGPGDDACFLCAKPRADVQDDRANLVLHRAEHVFVVMNLFPYNSGHVLVAPYEHTGDFVGLSSTIAEELTSMVQRVVGVLQAEYRPQGFNVGMNLGHSAGAGVPDHLHVHVVPRWNGDTNFMPIVGATKVLPESLEQTYDRLEPRFRD